MGKYILDTSIITVNYHSTLLINEYERRLSGVSSFELIVVDNCGTFEPVCDTTKIVKPGGNVGFGCGNNLGFKAASGDVIIFLNPDTDFSIEELEKLTKSSGRQSRSIWGPMILNESKRLTTLRHPGRFGLAFSRVDVTEELLSLEKVLEVVYVTGACLATTAGFFEEIGGFADDIFLYGEDLELCLRARSVGGKVFMDTSVRGYHVGGGSSDQPKRRFRRLFRSCAGHYRALRRSCSPIMAAINAVHLASGWKI